MVYDQLLVKYLPPLLCFRTFTETNIFLLRVSPPPLFDDEPATTVSRLPGPPGGKPLEAHTVVTGTRFLPER